MGLFKKLFGTNNSNELTEDGKQQLENILQREVSTFKSDVLWVVGEACPADADAVYVVLADMKFSYVYRISSANGILSVSDAFITSEEEFNGFDFNDEGNRLLLHFTSLNGTADISVEPNVCRVLGNTKIVKSQGREFMAMKNILCPNYRTICQEKNINKNSFTGVNKIVKELSDTERKNLKAFIANGDITQAIKLLREVTGYGLAEAKELVERQDFKLML